MYYARMQPTLGVYDLCEVVVMIVNSNWFSAMDKIDKRIYLFSTKDIDMRVFDDRESALSIIRMFGYNKQNTHLQKILMTINEINVEEKRVYG